MIGKFEHKRSDGLSACLLRAAKCASDAEQRKDIEAWEKEKKKNATGDVQS